MLYSRVEKKIMDLQQYLKTKFENWQPVSPEVVGRSKYDVTLSWSQDTFGFLAEELLYRIEKKEKMPPWVVVYSGSKTTQRIDNLAPCSPHKFRLKVILKASAVHQLAEIATHYYGSEANVYEKITGEKFNDNEDDKSKTKSNVTNNCIGGDNVNKTDNETQRTVDESGDNIFDKQAEESVEVEDTKHKWLESRWSEEACTSTESVGTSASCFCMAVRGGYLKQVQIMLEERPALIGIINSTNGYTPLATAVRKGDINTVRYLLAAGAETDQLSSTAQTPLHLAVLGAHTAIVDLLLEKGANFHYQKLTFCTGAAQARDRNELRVEHCAVDSCDVTTLRFILDRGGDVTVTDNNGWTPLFRAVCQGASSAVIEELVQRGSDVEVTDRAGLTLTAAARLLTNRHGQQRDSVLRLVDSQYPHEKALANFTKLTKKISSVHTLVKP